MCSSDLAEIADPDGDFRRSGTLGFELDPYVPAFVVGFDGRFTQFEFAVQHAETQSLTSGQGRVGASSKRRKLRS